MPTDTVPPPVPPPEDATAPRYLVVLDGEGMYSIWPEDMDVPAGWSAEGFGGTREACLAHVEAVWTDMRPLSLRRAMDAGH
ncbi:MAG TPA: MbtH family NRPS accessory protein [Azospirillaceae bacterium]|nr:MbtH family NRPS accessory protein [Azospirillaceae bacterium]